VVRREVHATVVLLRGQSELASWPMTGDGRPDLSVVDALARMQLAARRAGCAIQVRDVCPQLSELLDLVGLCGWAGPGRPCLEVVDLAGEARRQPEDGEQVGVEEVVVADDPVA
jgi:hypothetical protein